MRTHKRRRTKAAILGSFYTPETRFHLKAGSKYEVLGLGVWGPALIALVCDETGEPNWHPIEVFELGVQKMPSDWEFSRRAASDAEILGRWVAVWGYPELVRNVNHSQLLIERDPDALKIFFRELAKR